MKILKSIIRYVFSKKYKSLKPGSYRARIKSISRASNQYGEYITVNLCTLKED